MNYKMQDYGIATLLLGAAIVIFLFLVFSIMFFMVYYKKKKKLDEEIRSVMVEVQENTLRDISWLLHDNLGQLLSVLNLQLHQLKHQFNEEEVGVLKGINSAIQINEKALQEVRATSHSLNREYLNSSNLEDLIQEDVNRMKQLKFIEIDYQIMGTPFELSQAENLILFRIYQEFENNTLKHSQAEKLKVLLEYKNRFLTLKLQDDGIGFNPNNTSPGIGLQNIYHRAEIIGAEVDLHSDQNGTRLTIELNL